jgi:hypothetical protein
MTDKPARGILNRGLSLRWFLKDKTDKELAAPVALDFFIEGIEPLVEEIERLKNRLAEIERKGVEFCGTHQRSLDYRRGSMVVSGGSLWAAVRDVAAGEVEPGKGNPGWQLAAKAGRDGKDAR